MFIHFLFNSIHHGKRGGAPLFSTPTPTTKLMILFPDSLNPPPIPHPPPPPPTLHILVFISM